MQQYTIDFIAQRDGEENKGYFSSHKRYPAENLDDARIRLLPEINKWFEEATNKGYFVSKFFINNDVNSNDSCEVFIDGLVELPVTGALKHPLKKKTNMTDA